MTNWVSAMERVKISLNIYHEQVEVKINITQFNF